MKRVDTTVTKCLSLFELQSIQLLNISTENTILPQIYHCPGFVFSFPLSIFHNWIPLNRYAVYSVPNRKGQIESQIFTYIYIYGMPISRIDWDVGASWDFNKALKAFDQSETVET